MTYISGSKLKGDIYEYRRTKAKNITVKRYTKTEKIIEKAQDVLNQYNEDKIQVHTSDQKIMAEYIDTFGFHLRDGLLDKLQKDSSFDVNKYLETLKLTWWQRTFHIKPKQPEYMSASQLQKRLKQYKKLGKELSRGFYHGEKRYIEQQRLEIEAINYAGKVFNNRVEVMPQDVSVLKKYLQVLGNANYEPMTQKALQKLENMPADTSVETTKTNRFAAFFKKIKQRFTNKKAKEVNIKSAKPVATSHKSFWTRTKVAGLAVLLSVAGLMGIKSDKNASGKIINKTEQTAQPKKTITDAKTVVMQPVQQQELTAEQKIWQNFYNTKNEMLADMLKLDADLMKKSLQAKANQGLFRMPQNILVEQMVYTHLIYKAYGLPSPIDNALTATQKVPSAQQLEIEQAVETAGQNGMGVKKIAATQAAKSGKQLNHRSAYDRASKKLQKSFITNLKQVRQLHQR